MAPLSETERNLDRLATVHYVIGVAYLLAGCFPVIHLVVGVALMAFPASVPDEVWPARLAGGIFTAVAVFLIVLFWTLGAAVFFAGRSLASRRRHGYCLAVAVFEAITCVPVGTVLGVFTFTTLNKPEARALFGP